jgi:cysteine desulfurase
MSSPIYLDSHATTPVDPRVVQEMLPFFTGNCGNPSSPEHYHGSKAKSAVESSRRTLAGIIGCRHETEIVFTSGATESNAMALIGCFRSIRERGNHIIASSVEHPSVLENLESLKLEGAEITLVPVDRHGEVDPDLLRGMIRPETVLVSVMFANNEIGTIQPVAEIGRICRRAGVIFHCDAAQALGHEQVDVAAMGVDLLSFSAHKFYGPKGIGGLYVRSGEPLIELRPMVRGGGQERGLRPGTLNVPGIVGMAAALKIAEAEMEANTTLIRESSEIILQELRKAFPLLKVNGHPRNKLARNLSLTIPGIEAKALIQFLGGSLSFSAGSACSSVKSEPSHVLKAISLSDEEAFSTIRLGLSPGVDPLETARILASGITASPVFID